MQTGVYRHYKGKFYLVLGVARQTESDEELVIYVPLYEHEEGGRPLQARPLEMWTENVMCRGRLRSRFEYWGEKLLPAEPEKRTGKRPRAKGK